MDVKQLLDSITANPAASARPVLLAVSATLALLLLYRVGPRIWRVIENIFFTNWQLALLGSAALILSLAGGWTTWDGMTNFTGETVLSLMFTFGIHGVMLIVAWLIGESFATGMSTVPRGDVGRVTAPLVVVIGLGVVLLAAAAAVYQWRYGIAADRWIQVLTAAGLVLGALGLIVLFARTDVVTPYAQALRIIAKNSMLWVMFLACMSTSVFFSFDSRFNAVFPKEQRERVSELRAQNQVSGIVSDIGATMADQQIVETKQLFESDGWHAYDANLDKLAAIAQGSTAEIERYFNDQIEARNRDIKEQQERITTAQSGVAGLAGKKTSLTDELGRLEQDRATLAADYASAKTELDSRARGIDAKRVEAMAESKGVEGTLKEGRGPVYRQIMADLDKLKAAYKIQDDRVKDAKKRLDTAEARIAQIKHELAAIDGDLARYKGEQQTAEQRISMVQESAAGDESGRVDPARVLPAFEQARAIFRQEPTPEHLTAVQQRCSQLSSALYAADVTRSKVAGIECDPKQASEAAGALFALVNGSRTFTANCAGGDKLARNKSTDALFAFAVKCLADSGLPSKQTDELRTKISFAEMNRDDKAHRFVVTWNAFQDGNRLAYLALAIAIGIDSLIFMTGLFGANAVRSPLADVPSPKPRNSQQLEAIIENALLPDSFENARVTLQALRPITNEAGFMAEVRPELLDPHSESRVTGVLNAGATINAVAYDELRGRYLVRSELFEFLSIVAKRAFEANDDHAVLAELEKVVGVALLPDLSGNAEVVLHYMHPISEDRGFTAEIKLDEVGPDHIRTVRNTLNAGATLDRVQRAGKDAKHYFIHRDLYKTLAMIRARTLAAEGGPARIDGPARGSRFGGSITERTRALEDHRAAKEAEQPQLSFAGAEDANEAHAMRADLVGDLLEALHIDAETYQRATGPQVGAAAAASQAFERARHSNQTLDDELTARDEQARIALDNAYTMLKSRLRPNQTRAMASLGEAYAEIDRNWAVLMLLPNGPYETVLREIVEALEADAGEDRLSTEDAGLYGLARGLADAFRSNGRRSEISWRRLAQSLEQAPFREQRASFEEEDDGETKVIN
jgi:hypothetical protein